MVIMPAAMGMDRRITRGLEIPGGAQSGSPGDLRQRVILPGRKLERTGGESLATRNGRCPVDFGSVSHEPVDIEEAGR